MMPWQQSERRRFRRHLHSSKSAHGRTKAENRRCWRPYSAFSARGADTPPKRFLSGRRAVSPDFLSIPPAARVRHPLPRASVLRVAHKGHTAGFSRPAWAHVDNPRYSHRADG
jgi:hypothetical protein